MSCAGRMNRGSPWPHDGRAMLTMGSLFDGIGGFPLAAVRNGMALVLRAG